MRPIVHGTFYGEPFTWDGKEAHSDTLTDEERGMLAWYVTGPRSRKVMMPWLFALRVGWDQAFRGDVVIVGIDEGAGVKPIDWSAITYKQEGAIH